MAEKAEHGVPVGALVELTGGSRFWVIYHTYGSHGEPLYELSGSRDENVKDRDRKRVGAYPESEFKILHSGGDMLTPAEVATELSLNIRTIYGLLRRGALPHINLGHRTKRIRRSVLDAYIAARETNTCS